MMDSWPRAEPGKVAANMTWCLMKGEGRRKLGLVEGACLGKVPGGEVMVTGTGVRGRREEETREEETRE